MTATAHDAELDRIKAAIRKMNPEQRAQILSVARPRIVEPYFAHVPHPKQQVFLGMKSNEVMFGGSAGPGKSDALLMSALQYVDVPGYSALILRRTWPDLTAANSILSRAENWLMGTDAAKKDGGRYWVFPSGARLSFGYMQYDADVAKFQSAEYQFVGFDELTHFTEYQYTYMFSRMRRPQVACLSCMKPVERRTPNSRNPSPWKHRDADNRCDELFPDPKVLAQYPAAADGMTIFDTPLRMRSATNPGGIGHDWVKARFIDPKTRLESATFLPALLRDNPSVDKETYVQNLTHLLPVERERLLNGDWDISPEGTMFRRHWFKPVAEVPATRQVVRFWDNAASANKGDWTVGLKLRVDTDGRWFIEDIVRGQWSPAQKQTIIQQTAIADGRYCRVVMEQEPGSSGVEVSAMYRRLLTGFAFDSPRPTGDKQTRAVPAANAAEAGNVYMLTGQWNKPFLDEIEQFPHGQNDDQVDALSGAMSAISGQLHSRIIV